MVLDIIKYPDPRLEQVSQKAQINKELEVLVQNMLETINSFKDPQAAGLSAVQVGVPIRVLIAREAIPVDSAATNPKSLTQDFILINPKIVSLSKEEELDWEGCLSFPDLYGEVWRSKKVKVKYQDLKGQEQRLTVANFLARVIQHEMDHLNGVTFDTKVVGKMYKGEELDAQIKVAN